MTIRPGAVAGLAAGRYEVRFTGALEGAVL
jgi:hypothetical protein